MYLKQYLYILICILIGSLFGGIDGCVSADAQIERQIRAQLTPQTMELPAPEAETPTLQFAEFRLTDTQLRERIERIRAGENEVRAQAKAYYVAQIEISDDFSQLYYLAAAVCNEAGGESDEIMLLVANVIMNRVESDAFPGSVYGVLTQKYQYGTMWRDGISFPDWATQEIRERCYAAAQRVLSGERYCPASVVYQAEFEQGSGVYAFYPGFYFCYQ